jgi:hypothetical protein
MSSGRSVGIVRLQTEVKEFVLSFYCWEIQGKGAILQARLGILWTKVVYLYVCVYIHTHTHTHTHTHYVWCGFICNGGYRLWISVVPMRVGAVCSWNMKEYITTFLKYMHEWMYPSVLEVWMIACIRSWSMTEYTLYTFWIAFMNECILMFLKYEWTYPYVLGVCMNVSTRSWSVN